MAEPGTEAAHTGEGVAGKTSDATSAHGSGAKPATALDPKAPDGSRTRTLWLLIDSALIVLIAVGAYYFFYTKGRQTYIAERNYRLLNSVSQQLRRRVDGLQMIFDSAASECATTDGYPAECGKTEATAWGCCVQHSSLRQDSTVRRVDCALGSPDSHSTAADGKASVPRVLDLPVMGKVLFISAKNVDGHPLCGAVALSDLVDLTLASKMFDRVLLVGGGGEVLYQKGPAVTQPTEIKKILEEQWRALCPSTEGQSTSAAKDEHTESPRTTLVPYAQLVRLTSTGPAAACDRAQDWMIVGLIPLTRAFAEPMAVPLGLLIPATFLVLLALLAWPLMKLWQMSNLERLRAFELHVLLLAGLTATGMLTFAILSRATEGAASKRLDDNLEQIAHALQWRFQDEIHCAFAELNEFRNHPPEPSAQKPIQYYPWFMNLVSADASGKPTRTFKPVPEGDLWHLGDAPNLQFNVSDRPYFRAARAPERADSLLWTWTIPTWKADQSSAGRGGDMAGSAVAFRTSECLQDPGKALEPSKPVQFAIQPLVSRSSGAMTVVLAVPNGARARGEGPNGVDVLATPLLSLTQPVLPVGFQFAIVDASGLVQFHADPTRNLQENFFDETDSHRGLRAAVLTRREQYLNVDYYAWPERVYVMPLKDTPWSVIVFHQQLMSFSLSFAVAIAWLLTWGMYLAVYIVADVIVQWIRPGYPAPWLWPDRSRRYVFALLGLALTLWFAAHFVLKNQDPEVAFEVLVAIAPLTALAVVYVSSLSRPMQGCVFGTLLGAAAGTLLLQCNGYSWPWSLALSTAFVVTLGYAASRLPARPQRNEWMFRCGYVTVNCALLLICGVLPAMLFFREAYQQSAQNFEKYVQWRFADELVERAARVRREMAKAFSDTSASGQLGALVNSRLAMRWDIYDSGLPADAGREAAPPPVESEPSAPAKLCQIDIVADPADLLKTSSSGASGSVCESQDMSGELGTLPLLRPKVDDPFADLLPNLSAPAATDHAWEWSGPAGQTFTICERRLNDQIGTPGTCARPLRIGWGLVPVRFTAGFSPKLALVGGICALLVFGLMWTIVRFLFVLDADAKEQAGPAEEALPSSAAPNEIWSSLDDVQKLALAQTAVYGVPNPKNHEAVAYLLRKGVLVRRPELSVASRKVRDFVLSSKAQNDIQELEKHIPPSDWSRLRGPLSVLVVCLVVFVFGIQQGLIDSAAALVTGLTGTIGAATTVLTRLSGIWSRGISSILNDGGGGEKKQ